MSKPRLVISAGDPGGIGPEILLKALIELKGPWPFIPIFIVSKHVLEDPFYTPYLKQISIDYSLPEEAKENTLYVLHSKYTKTNTSIGENTAENGEASYTYICEALELIQEKKADGMVTCPISKTAFKFADIPYTGHTTLLKSKTNSKNVSMGFYSKELKVVLATVHIPLQKVATALNKEVLDNTLANSLRFADLLGIQTPKIAVAGLNPHAGEHGLLGFEETEQITPFIKENEGVGVSLEGPVPADTLFWHAKNGDYDIVIALYHDQGLIPIKTLAFDRAVNISLGLPFIRTSPDHGTGFDIAHTGTASAKSMTEALLLCTRCIPNS